MGLQIGLDGTAWASDFNWGFANKHQLLPFIIWAALRKWRSKLDFEFKQHYFSTVASL